jgi:hypothetical protein
MNVFTAIESKFLKIISKNTGVLNTQIYRTVNNTVFQLLNAFIVCLFYIG